MTETLKMRRKTIKKRGGSSKAYNEDGDIVPIEEMYKGNPIFRKYTEHKGELEIAEIIKNNPHQNIVTIYNVEANYYDMELLKINYKHNKDIIIETMEDVKIHLQNLGVAYIDWKYDNIGKDNNGNFKLFDFDCSGVFNTKNIWKTSPDIKCWAFRNAIRVSLIDSVKDSTERETMEKIAHLIEEIRSIDGKNILGKLIDSSKAGKSINPKIVDDIAFSSWFNI